MAAAHHAPAALDRRGVVWGLVGVAIVVAVTFLGSDGLVWFDADERWLEGVLPELCRAIADAAVDATGTPFSVSIGAVHAARPSGDPARALRAADAVLLQIKGSGRGRSALERFVP